MVFSSRCIFGRSERLYSWFLYNLFLRSFLVCWYFGLDPPPSGQFSALPGNHENVAHGAVHLLCFLCCNCKTSSDHFWQDSSSAHSCIGIERSELIFFDFSNQSGRLPNEGSLGSFDSTNWSTGIQFEALLVTGVLSWSDCVREEAPWKQSSSDDRFCFKFLKLITEMELAFLQEK